MNFIAIDFETANSKRSSACSIGVAIVKDGEVVDTHYELIKPDPFYFEPFNTSIHGISEEHVIDKPSFHDIYNSGLNEIIRNNIIVCHNAAFDMSVLRHALGSSLDTLDHEISYICSLVIGKMLVESAPNYKLPTLCRHFGIELENHHNALDDAIACAKLTTKLAESLNANSIESFLEHLECQIGAITYDGYQPFSNSYSRFRSANTVANKPHSAISLGVGLDLDDFMSIGSELFEDRTVVYSGIFLLFERSDLKAFLEECGAKVTSSISSKTDYLIAGDNMGPAKLEKATKLGINIISEEEFIKMING